MTHYHNNHALVSCIDPSTFKVIQDSPQQFEVDGQLIDLLPFERWEHVGTIHDTGRQDWAEITGHNYLEATAMKDLLESLNLAPATTLVFKEKK